MRVTRLESKLHDRLYTPCCICGKVKDTGAGTPENINTCGDLCKQLFVFLQGLVCGNALCYLVGRSDGGGVDLAGEIDFCYSREGRCDAAGLTLDTQTLGCLKSESSGMRVNSEADFESTRVEELLQVTFDQDSTEVQSDADLEFVSPLSSVPPTPPLGQSPVGQLPSVDILRPHQAACKRTRPIGPRSVKTNTASSVKKRHKHKYSVKRFASKKAPSSASVTVSESRSVALHDGHLSNKRETSVTLSSSSNSNEKKRVECGICGETFIETHLYVHMKAKHIERLTKEEVDLMFSCSECDKKFDKQSHLNKHLAKKHPTCEKLTKSCTICHKGFSNQIGLSVHMRHVHQALSPKECNLCEKTFKSCKELSRHKLRDHQLRVHICHLCGKNFAYGHALKSHLDAHAGVKKHFCEICGEGFVRMTSLCGHRVSAHSKKDDIVYKCELCESRFDTKALLNKHLFEYHFTGPYAIKDYRKQLSMVEEQKCQVCKDAKDNSGKCSLHAVEEAKEFICSHCGKKFSKSHYLKAHEKQHQEAKFSCDICCKRFTYKCNLKAHRSTHSSDKPFQCTVCTKKFRLKFLLEDHQRTHNRELLFKCYICGRGLTRIPNLKRHIRVMHPEVNYEQHVLELQEKNGSRYAEIN